MKQITKTIIICVLVLFFWGCVHYRQTTALKTNDQTLLSKFAAEDHDISVRLIAINKLTDTTLLAKIANNKEKDLVALKAASYAKVKLLTNQTLLANIAMNDQDYIIRRLAIGNITNQEILKEITIGQENSTGNYVKNNRDKNIRELALKKITNQAILSKIINKGYDDNIRAQAIFKLDSVPLIKQLAGDLDKVDNNHIFQSLARIKLAMYESIIEKHVNGTIIRVQIDEVSRDYQPSQVNLPSFTIQGKNVYISMKKNDKFLAGRSWNCVFPQSANSVTKSLFTIIKGNEFFDVLFRTEAFTKEELTELLHSNIPEIRISAEDRLKQLSLMK